jgi:hypothetical protein
MILKDLEDYLEELRKEKVKIKRKNNEVGD